MIIDFSVLLQEHIVKVLVDSCVEPRPISCDLVATPGRYEGLRPLPLNKYIVVNER